MSNQLITHRFLADVIGGIDFFNLLHLEYK